MGGSPKYTAVGSGEERLRQAAVERAARERRRREQERRARAAAVAGAQRRARARADEVNERLVRLAGLQRGPADPSLLSTIDRVRVDLAAAGRAIEPAQDLHAVNEAVRAIEAADRSLVDLQTRILAAQQRVDALAGMLDEVALPLRTRHDPAGAGEVDRLLVQARGHVTSGLLDTLAARVGRHLETVLCRRAELDEQRADAIEAVARLRERLVVLGADAEAVGVDLADGDGARAGVDHLAALLESAEFAQVLRAAPGVADRIVALESTLDLSIRCLIERRALLTSIVSALPGLGFEVDEATLQESGEGTVVLRAHRRDEGLTVLVRGGGPGRAEVLYAMDGDSGALGDVIEALREQATRDGFEVGAVQDDPGPPDGHR